MSQDDSDSDSSSQVFEVESILAKRYNGQRARVEYLIKWATYDLYEASWEPEEALKQNAEEALSDFRTICALRAQGELAEFDVAEFEEKQALYQEAQSVASSGSVQIVDAVSRPSATYNSILIDSDSNESDRPLKQTTPREDHLSEELSDEEEEDNLPLKETTSIIKSSIRHLKILPEHQPAPIPLRRSVLLAFASSNSVQQHKKPAALSKELSKIRSSLVAKARSEAQVISAVRARKALSPEVTRSGVPGSAALKRKSSQTGFEQGQRQERELRDAVQQPSVGDDFVYEQQTLATPESPNVSHRHQEDEPGTSAPLSCVSPSPSGSGSSAAMARFPDMSQMMHAGKSPQLSRRSAKNSPTRPRLDQGQLPKSPDAAKGLHEVACSPVAPDVPARTIINNASQQRDPKVGPRVIVNSQKVMLSQSSVVIQFPRRNESTAAVPSQQKSPMSTPLQCPDLQLLCITDPDEGRIDFGRFQVMDLPPDSVFMEALAPFHAADPGAVYEMTTRSTFSTHILVDALAKRSTQCCIAPLISVSNTSNLIEKYCRRGVSLFEDPNFVGLLVTKKSDAFEAIQMLSKDRPDGMVAHQPTPYYFIFVTKSPVTMLQDNDVHRIGLMTEFGEQAHLLGMYQALGPHLAALDQGGMVHLEGPRGHPDVLAVMTFLEKRLKLRSHSSIIDSMEASKAQQQPLFVLLHRSVFAPPYTMSACKGLAQAKNDRTVQFIVFGEAPSTISAGLSNDNLAPVESESSIKGKIYKCDVEGCWKTYKTKKSFTSHVKNHEHNPHDQRVAHRPYICPLCGKRYNEIKHLKYHGKRQHAAAPSHWKFQNALEAGWAPQTSFSALAFPAAITLSNLPSRQGKSACHIIVESYAANLTSLRALVRLLGTSRFQWHIYIPSMALKWAGIISYRRGLVAEETVQAAYGILGRIDDSDALFQPQSEEEASLLGQLVIEQWMQHGCMHVLDNVDYKDVNGTSNSSQPSTALNLGFLPDAFSMAAWKQVRDFQTHRHTLVLVANERSLKEWPKAEGIEATTLVELAKSFTRFQ